MYIRTKNREAPLVWINRDTHPISLSRMILTMTENAREVSAVYIIDTAIPEMIWMVRVNPSKNPKFHRNEIEVGVGKSRRDFFIRLAIGFIFISCFFIRMRSLMFGLGGVRERIRLVGLELGLSLSILVSFVLRMILCLPVVFLTLLFLVLELLELPARRCFFS